MTIKGMDGNQIRTGDVLLCFNSPTLRYHVVDSVEDDGVIIDGGRFIPDFIVEAAWFRYKGANQLVDQKRRDRKSYQKKLRRAWEGTK